MNADNTNERVPSREEAKALLDWAGELNPGPWTRHCEVAARVAEGIAGACGLDADRAYVLGLLHDIGRYEGVRNLHHLFAGYELMLSKGYPACARICLTHSFPFQQFESYTGVYDCTDGEIALLRERLHAIEYDDYDRLIQLCDALSLPDGACMVEVRLVDVELRYGINEYTPQKWKATMDIKARFDELCGRNIYELFREEIIRSVFR